MDGKFSEGERIVIKLNSGENYEGDFVKGTKNRIEIENIHHYESGNKVDSMLCFYPREIESIYRLNIKKNESLEKSCVNQNKSAQPADSILIPRDEYERLKEVANNYIYIKTDDRTYYDSVNQILNFEHIGVFTIGSEKGRCGRISLIVISTWKQVYIFDLKNFRSKKFPIEIADILECSYIKKVVHNGGALKDCLFYTHKITINNVFDTQVSDLLITKNSTGECPPTLKSIGECLTEYFNFPSTLLTSSLECLKGNWEDRPLEEDKLNKLSRLVTYLITLKDYQIGRMLTNYDKAVNDYYNLFTKSSEYEMMRRSSSDKCTKDIDNIIPKELLKLKINENVMSE